ncbi:MAG TPA: molybdate ABC transporter substrate-binding protein [Candidatus Propionivibrio aalborgensis]|nr:molybdate ABC transporter substrate-binding protein [Candidatus Propionivibrio aalborgensis]
MVRIPTNKWIAPLALVLFLVVQLTLPARAEEKITLAAAADLKYALDEVVVLFIRENPDARVETVYGSSGKFHAQIRQGAPYDLYFSADIAYPRALVEAGLAASEVQPYGIGRIVLWGTTRDAAKMTLMALADLADPAITRIAMANPRHAPYGQRAEEALRSAGIWERVKPRLVFGENVAQSAQFVQTGNAQFGIIALSLALSPELSEHGSYVLIPETLHRPLEQGFIITRRAAGKPLAQRFARFMKGTDARATMTRYGFVLPGEAK